MTFNSWYNFKKIKRKWPMLPQFHFDLIHFKKYFLFLTWGSSDVHFFEVFALKNTNSKFSRRRYIPQGKANISQILHEIVCEREKKKIKERRKLCKFICKEWPKAKIFGQSKRFVVVVLIWGPLLFYIGNWNQKEPSSNKCVIPKAKSFV